MSEFKKYFEEQSEIPPDHAQDEDELTVVQHFYKPTFEMHSNENRLFLEEKVLPTLVPCLEKLLQLVEEEQINHMDQESLVHNSASSGTTYPGVESNGTAGSGVEGDLHTKKLIRVSTGSQRTPKRHDQYNVTHPEQVNLQKYSESAYARRDPLNWLAMSLMRHNLKHSNELKSHPYTKELLEHVHKVRANLEK